jgi:hypothetical protein
MNTPMPAPEKEARSTPENGKSSVLARAGVVALILGAVGSAVELLKGLTDLLEKWPVFVKALEQFPLPARWAVILAVVVLGVIGLVRTYSTRSRLLRPDQFTLDPDNPRHLKGRETDVKDLLDNCVNAPLVELTGESGSGKSALVRSGLIPAIEKDKRLRPFYLDCYGQDWESGPLDILTGVLQRDLTADERAALGLTHPVSRDDVFPLLGEFQEKTGRAPLIVFDQFDDYQAAQRERFRHNNGNWLKPATVEKNNPFWKNVSEHLNAGRLKALLVTRADMASGLSAVRFCESESRPLDRLSAAQLMPLLEELTPAGADPPVVQDPASGWEQLRRRLERDLQNDGLALPVRVLLAVRGLACLPGQALTVRNYERVGGAAGLEAVYIEESITRCVQSLRAHGVTDVDPERVRTLLLTLVDEDGKKEGTVPRRMSDLAAKLQGTSPDLAAKVLSELERLGLVRRRHPEPGGAGANGHGREEWWSLYHDYLSRGVRAADRRANHWTNLLREQHRAFDEASGSLLARWRTLLSPVQQVRLCWHRLGRRFHYAEHTRFAVASLVRFLPLLLACGAVGLAAVLIVEERKRQDAEKDAIALVQEVARTDRRTLLRGEALWRLARGRPLTTRYFWHKALADPSLAEGINGSVDLAFHATVGLDPDGVERAYLIDHVLDPALDQQSLNAATLRLMARLSAAANLNRDKVASRLGDQLLDALAKEKDPFARKELARALVGVPGLKPAQAMRARALLLDALAKEKKSYPQRELAEALAGVPGLTAEEAERARALLLDALAKEPDSSSRGQLAEALAAVPGLTPAESERATTLLLDALAKEQDHNAQKALVEALAAVPGLKAAEAERAAKLLLDALAKERLPTDRTGLAMALAAIAPNMEPRQAATLLLDALAKERDPYAQTYLARALAAVPGLKTAEAERAATLLLLQFDENRVAGFRSSLDWALPAVVAKMEPEQAATLRREALGKVQNPDAPIALALALAAEPGLTAAEAERAAKLLLDALAQQRGDPYAKSALAEALTAAAAKMEPVQAALLLLGAVAKEQKRDPGNEQQRDTDKYLVKTLITVSGSLDQKKQLEFLFEVLGWPTCDEEVRTLILKRLETLRGGPFQDGIFEAARWARDQGIDITKPPRRPGE